MEDTRVRLRSGAGESFPATAEFWARRGIFRGIIYPTMNGLLPRCTALCIACTLMLGLASAPAREFTQKETGKTLQGKLLGVNSDAGTVTMRLDGGRNVTFNYEILIEEDIGFLKEWARKKALADRISISATRIAGERGKQKSGEIYEYRYEEAAFSISLRNTHTSETIPEVPINWHMVVTRANGNTEVVSGSETFKFLTASSSREIATDPVKLVTSCKSLSSCPKCVDHAKQFKGDRLEGILIELADENGEIVQEVFSPNMRESRIREALEAKAAK